MAECIFSGYKPFLSAKESEAMKYALIPLLFLMLAGCELLESSDVSDVSLEVDRQSYQPGQEVVLTLANSSGRTFSVHPNLCGAVLQQRVRAAWVPEHHEGVCTSIGLELRSGKEVVSRRELSDMLSAGEYRYMYALSKWEDRDGGRYRRFERIELYTRVFQVKP